MTGSDVVSQLEVVLAGIEERTAHGATCPVAKYPSGKRGKPFACRCDWWVRVRSEIARVWLASLKECERNATLSASDQTAVEDFPTIGALEAALAAAFRAVQP